MASLECNDNAVLLSLQDNVAWVTLNCPDKGNRLDEPLIKKLAAIFAELKDNPEIRVIVLQAQGKHFCLGASIAHMQSQKDVPFEMNFADATILATLFETIAHILKPVVAVVHGKVYGGGVGLVACADIVLCDENAEFCLSELKLGLIPAVISPYVVNAMGVRQSKRLMMLATPFSAEIAEKLGLVHALFNVKNHQSLLDETIHTLLQSAPIAMSTLKAFYTQFEQSVSVEARAELLANLRIQPEAQEGFSAFIEKRKPNWSVEK